MNYGNEVLGGNLITEAKILVARTGTHKVE